MTIKEFVQSRTGIVCITGHVNRILNHQFDNYTLQPVYKFPENGMHVDDQANFVKELHRTSTGHAIILTHSAFIVSDFHKEDILVIPKEGTEYKSPDFNTFGASANKITMCLFDHPHTISALAIDALESVRRMPTDTLEQIQKIKDRYKEFGDSVELTLTFHTIFDKEDELKKLS